MQSTTENVPVLKSQLWTGRIVSTLVALFLLLDSGMKILKMPAAVQGTMQIGFPENTVLPIGIALLVSVIIYVIPRTSILGAILITGYLGGATASTVRMSNPWFLFPVVLGVLAWVGIFLRDRRLRTLIPLRRP